jgi:hypothetical protein
MADRAALRALKADHPPTETREETPRGGTQTADPKAGGGER